MPSPDATPYIDLTIYDKDPQDIYDDAALQLQVDLPDWIPREGNIEVLLMEALALEISELGFSVNRLPSGIVEVLLQLFGITRSIGNAPVATLTFNVAINTGVVIPAGTQVVLALAGGLPSITFLTNVELDIPNGSSSGTVLATGDSFTDTANNATSGTVMQLLDAVAYVDSVTWLSISTAGAPPESDTDYFNRALQRFNRLSDTLVLAEHFTAFTLENPLFVRAYTLDNWDANPVNTPGTIAGHVTVAVYGDNRLTTSGEKTTLQTSMTPLVLANLVTHIIDPTITPVNVTATVQALPGYDSATVSASITAALTDYLSPMSWAWGGTVRLYELIALINNVPGVDFIQTMTTPNADITLTGKANLVSLGTVTLTVNTV